MRQKVRFRVLLPIAQTSSAAVLSWVGLCQRHHILGQPLWGDQTLWDSTARFHIWPWPFKLAVVTNVPAFLAGALVAGPVARVWPTVPEEVAYLALPLTFVPLLWYWVGAHFDAETQHPERRHWLVLVAFTSVCGLGVLVPGYVGYIPYGILVWLAFTVILVRLSRSGARRNLHLPTVH